MNENAVWYYITNNVTTIRFHDISYMKIINKGT